MIGGDQADKDMVLMAQERTRLNAEVRQLEKTLLPLIHPHLDLHDLDNDAALEVWDTAQFQLKKAVNEWLEKARTTWPSETPVHVVLVEKCCSHTEKIRSRLAKIPYIRDQSETVKSLVDFTREQIFQKKSSKEPIRNTRNMTYYSPMANLGASYRINSISQKRRDRSNLSKHANSPRPPTSPPSKATNDAEDDDDDETEEEEETKENDAYGADVVIDDAEVAVPEDILAMEAEAEQEKEQH